MKSLTFKKVFQVILFSAVILTSAIITINRIKAIKHLYGLESPGNGITFFIDMIQ